MMSYPIKSGASAKASSLHLSQPKTKPSRLSVTGPSRVGAAVEPCSRRSRPGLTAAATAQSLTPSTAGGSGLPGVREDFREVSRCRYGFMQAQVCTKVDASMIKRTARTVAQVSGSFTA